MTDPIAARIQALRNADVLGFKTDVRLGPVDGDGWTTVTALCADDGALDARLAQIGADAGTDHPGVSSGWFMEKLGWLAACVVAASLIRDGAVPPLTDDGTPFRFGEHELPETLAVAPGGWIERDDAAEDARLAAALDRLEGYLAPLADALVARKMRPRRALWRQAGDQLAASFLWWGQAYDRLDEGQRLGELVLRMDSPFAVEPAFTTTDLYGPPMPWRTRASCCLAYHAGHELCAYCPRLVKQQQAAEAG